MKNSFSLRVALSLFAGASSVAFVPRVVWAQPAIGGGAAVEAPNETPVDIDPKAQKALEDLVALYKNLHSYADTTTVKSNADSEDVSQTAWERPNKGFAVRKQNGKVWRGVSDGTMLWAVNPDHAGYYLQRPTEANRFFPVFMEANVGGPGLGFIQDDFTLGELKKDGLKVLRFQGEEKVGAVLTRLVTAQLDFDDGGTGVITCYIGVEDGLLHQVSAEYTGMGRGTKIVETHTDIRLNPALPPDTWKFTPPAGLKPIDYYSALEPHRFDPLYKVGDLLPNFEVTALDGRKVDLATYGDGGKVVLLHFFMARSGQYEAKALQELLNQYGAQGLAVISVSMDGRRPIVEKFVQDNKVSWPVLFDGQGWQNAVATKYGVQSVTTIFLVGRDGRLLSIDGAMGSVEFEKALAEALKAPK